MIQKLASELRKGDMVTVDDGRSEALGHIQRVTPISTRDLCNPELARHIGDFPMLELFISCASGRFIPGATMPINLVTVCVAPDQIVRVAELRRSANYAA